MPMFVGRQGLLKALAFFRLGTVPALETAGRLEHTIDGRGAGRHEVGVHQQVGQTPIAFLRMLAVERQDCLPLPGFQPMDARHEPVVLIDLPVAFGLLVLRIRSMSQLIASRISANHRR
jgi:hypothetical protein